MPATPTGHGESITIFRMQINRGKGKTTKRGGLETSPPWGIQMALIDFGGWAIKGLGEITYFCHSSCLQTSSPSKGEQSVVLFFNWGMPSLYYEILIPAFAEEGGQHDPGCHECPGRRKTGDEGRASNWIINVPLCPNRVDLVDMF